MVDLVEGLCSKLQLNCKCTLSAKQKVMKRTPAVAGKFYPAHPDTLLSAVKGYLSGANAIDLPGLKALVCPHAGYPYSGPIAGGCYRQLSAPAEKPSVYFLIGPSHQAFIEASVGNFESYETPLGEVGVDRETASQIERAIPFIPEAHAQEHCLEVQLPFLQAVDPEARIVPVLCGSIGPEKLAGFLEPYFRKSGTFFIISSDLSHYLPYDEAVDKDRRTLDIITACDTAEEGRIDACGQTGIKALMRLTKKHGYRAKLLDYRNSGDTAGDKSAVVGYGAVAIYK